MILVEGAVEGEVERMEALAALAEVSLVKHDPFEDSTPAVIIADRTISPESRLPSSIITRTMQGSGASLRAVNYGSLISLIWMIQSLQIAQFGGRQAVPVTDQDHGRVSMAIPACLPGGRHQALDLGRRQVLADANWGI
jgi:hypothetical protein